MDGSGLDPEELLEPNTEVTIAEIVVGEDEVLNPNGARSENAAMRVYASVNASRFVQSGITMYLDCAIQ